MHIVEFVHICILSCTYFNRKHTHIHVRTYAHTHTHTHVNMFILTNKRSSIYIQTVFFFACFLCCKGGNLYCTRAVPLYLVFVFLSFSFFLCFFCTGVWFICLSVFCVEYCVYMYCTFVVELHLFTFFFVKMLIILE